MAVYLLGCMQFHHEVPEAADGSAEVGKDYRHMSADLR
jgi:hypothetical protein